MTGKNIDELKVVDRAQFAKTVSESDIYLYANVTGDFNPAHIDEEYAKKTFFETRIVHGMLTGGFISTVIGNQLPGYGTIYIRQELNFLAPVRIGDTITAQVEVLEIMTEKKQVRLKTTCFNQEEKTVLDGEAIISPPRGSKK
jgi:3-hydroxybutyryl-CoA dehydratase